MKETEFNGTQEPKEESIDVKELLFKYLLHWPWFVGAVVVCLITAWVYLYIATPVYNISATVLIKDDKKGGSAGMLSGLESLGLDGLMKCSVPRLSSKKWLKIWASIFLIRMRMNFFPGICIKLHQYK